MDVRLITVGDELLSGATANTNATWLGSALTDRGARVTRVTVLPDEVEVIAGVLTTDRAAADAVIVTGGLGPTHDDVTMEGVARSFQVELVAHPEVREWLLSHGDYAATDLAPETTHLPVGATPLHNRVGVAPGANLESVYVLPGVPAEMRAMFESVAHEFTGQELVRETVSIDEPESALVDRIETLRRRFDVTVGSYPGEIVRIRIKAPDRETVASASAWLRERSDVVSADEQPEPTDGDTEAESEYDGGQ